MTTRRRHGSGILMVGLLLTAPACRSGPDSSSDAAPTPAAGQAVLVNVTNHYNGPVDIYAAGSGTNYRMGTVLPGFAAQFVLRQAIVGHGPVELLARAGPGTRLVRTDRLQLSPGAIVDFEIGADLLLSTAVIRP